MLEWRRADTGVGPSIAAGSHRCIKNWADFPVAARINPIESRIVLVFVAMICSVVHEV